MKGEEDKEVLFKKTFDRKYNISEDYLLRNELRLLNNELEKFIIQTDALQSSKPDLSILHRAYESGNESLFQNYLSDILSVANQQQDYDVIEALYELNGKFIARYKEVSLHNYNRLLDDLKNEQIALYSLFEEKLSENRLRQHFAIRVLQQLGEKNEQEYAEISQLSESAKLIINYNNLIADSYLQNGEEKIKTLLTALELYPNVAKIRLEKQADSIKILGNVAIEYFLNQQYETAHKYYQEALGAMNETNLNIELLFNYCINALTIDRFDIFIEVYERYQKQITGNNKLKYRFQYFTAMAYLFENKPKIAFTFLDHDISKRPETEYYFYRMVYAMVYFQLGDFDMANRELENILQSFRSRKPNTQQDKTLVKIMQRLIITVVNRNNKQLFQSELAKLKQQTEAAATEVSNFSQTIYRWIHLRIKEML